MPVTIPATGSGTATPIVSTDNVTADSSQVQNVQWVTVSGGVLARISNANPVPISDAGGSLTVDAPVGTPAFVRLSDGSAAITTLPISAASLPLPAGAATAAGVSTVNTTLGTPMQNSGGSVTANLGTIAGVATQTTLASILAKQPALGTAGAASTDVLTIQGIASGVAIPVTGGGTPTDMTATGSLSGAASVSITGMNAMATAIIDVSGTFTGLSAFAEGTVDGSNWFAMGVFAPSGGTYVTGGGISALGDYWVPVSGLSGVRLRATVVSTGSAVIAIRASAGASPNRAVVITGSSTITVNSQLAGIVPSVGHGVSGTGVQRVELPTDGTGVVGLNAGANLIGKVGIDQTTPGTTNLVATELATGLTTFYNGALSNTKTAVKAGAGKVYGWMIHNPAAATTFIQVWNVAIGSITVGTTAATWEIAVPAGGTTNVFTDRGITHSTEINIAATTTAGGSTAPATAAICSMFYI